MNDSKSICGADCSECALKESCNGCIQTKGCPFGEQCIAASYIQVGGAEAYQKFNFFKASLLTIWRLLRCNPFSKGGFDPVPLTKEEKKLRKNTTEEGFDGTPQIFK